jgi:outer membrane protein assembly factor BamB
MRSAEPEVRGRRFARLLVAVTFAVAAGGCTLFSKGRTPPEPLPAPSGTVTPRAAWNVSLGARSGIGFAPVAIGDSVWAAAQDGTVARFDLESGRVAWRVSLGRTLSAGVGSDGTTTVAVGRDGTLFALDADGRTRWTAALGSEVVTPPSVADGTVILRTTDNRVLAYEAESGTRRWNFQRQNPPLVLRQSGGIAMVPGAAFVGMPGGRMVALALANGAPRWDVPFAQPKGATELERVTDIVGQPLIIGRELCAVAYQGRIGCLDLASGAPVWLKDFSSAVGLDVDTRGVVAPDANDTVHAFDRRGEPSWQSRSYARRRLTAPLIVGSAVALGDAEGNVLWLSRADGSLAAASRTDGKAIVAPPTASGPIVVVQTSGGALHAFGVR